VRLNLPNEVEAASGRWWNLVRQGTLRDNRHADHPDAPATSVAVHRAAPGATPRSAGEVPAMERPSPTLRLWISAATAGKA
jgi:hypothetical protein